MPRLSDDMPSTRYPTQGLCLPWPAAVLVGALDGTTALEATENSVRQPARRFKLVFLLLLVPSFDIAAVREEGCWTKAGPAADAPMGRRTPVKPARQRKRNVDQLESTALHSQNNSNLTPGFRILQGAGRSDSALGCFLQAAARWNSEHAPWTRFSTHHIVLLAVIACSPLSVLAIGS
jgi:hypothetical protein